MIAGRPSVFLIRQFVHIWGISWRALVEDPAPILRVEEVVTYLDTPESRA